MPIFSKAWSHANILTVEHPHDTETCIAIKRSGQVVVISDIWISVQILLGSILVSLFVAQTHYEWLGRQFIDSDQLKSFIDSIYNLDLLWFIT